MVINKTMGCVIDNCMICDLFMKYAWYVSCCYRQNAHDYMVRDLLFDDYSITGCVVCCAKCHFRPFLPFSSIS